MHDLVRAYPLATLVTLSADGLNANHIPLHLSEQPLPWGTLRGHVARANPMWSDLVEEIDVLAVFQGPDAYISPSLYATKKDTGKVVPTWNYAVVHAYGALKVIDDASWVRSRLEELTAQQEVVFTEPWQISDAPHEFTERLLGSIVGIEIVITKLLGKWKVSQNQPPENQKSVVQGLHANPAKDGQLMAQLVATWKKNTP